MALRRPVARAAVGAVGDAGPHRALAREPGGARFEARSRAKLPKVDSDYLPPKCVAMRRYMCGDPLRRLSRVAATTLTA